MKLNRVYAMCGKYDCMQMLKMWGEVKNCILGMAGAVKNKLCFQVGTAWCLMAPRRTLCCLLHDTWLLVWSLLSNETSLVYKPGHSSIKYNFLYYSPHLKPGSSLHVESQIQLTSTLCCPQVALTIGFLVTWKWKLGNRCIRGTSTIPGFVPSILIKHQKWSKM